MNPLSSDPMLVETEGGVWSAMQLASDGFKNLTVQDIVKELSTVAYSRDGDEDYGEDEEYDYRPVWARAETFVMAAVLGLIFIVGVLGNGTLIAIFLRHRGMRNIPNT